MAGNKDKHSYACFNVLRCGEWISAATEAALDEKARQEGWVLGLDATGQAHFACPFCGGALFNTQPIPQIRK